jgi:3-deoxy-D-manno-octulosonate 8-phosphate phosphatase (KDO 8-P phosphatase)
MAISGKEIEEKALRIKLLLTDCDGVLTDSGVYYSAGGEEMKRFSIRDGMGVTRLRKLVGVETGIITGENSDIVLRRAEKLRIKIYYPGIQDKGSQLKEILDSMHLNPDQIAYIGDDNNDMEIMKKVGLSACPADAMSFIVSIADVVLKNKGGYGAFREFAEIIISTQLK